MTFLCITPGMPKCKDLLQMSEREIDGNRMQNSGIFDQTFSPEIFRLFAFA
jgi:hypothetical protein